MSPYRTAPSAPVRAPRASWWRRLWSPRIGGRLEIRRLRLHAAREEPWATWRERHAWATEAVAYVRWRPWLRSLLLGAYARWLRWKAADRLTARSPGTCHTCGGAHGEPCDPYTHEFAVSGTAAGRDAAEVRRDNRIATRDAQATGVVTTFPAITAYREAARTGDWLTFSARDLSPVARLVHAPPEDAFEVDEERENARRGRTG